MFTSSNFLGGISRLYVSIFNGTFWGFGLVDIFHLDLDFIDSFLLSSNFWGLISLRYYYGHQNVLGLYFSHGFLFSSFHQNFFWASLVFFVVEILIFQHP